MPRMTPGEEEALVTRLESQGYEHRDYEDVATPDERPEGRHGVRVSGSAPAG